MLMSVKRGLKDQYRRWFEPHLHEAAEDYRYTDEHLKFVHILEAVNYVRVADLPRVYLEFGCHSGRTFAAAVRATRYLGMSDAQLFAFDSFQGLPETHREDDGTFMAGSFATAKEEFVRLVKRMSGYEVPAENVVEGFYSQSLTPELRARVPSPGVVHIDVDLYTSTVEVLEFIGPLLVQGTVLIFDDWYAFPPGANKGEARALAEFIERNPGVAVEEWKAYSTFGKSFFVTSPCRLTRG